MKSFCLIVGVFLSIAGLSCASRYGSLSHVDKIADISKITNQVNDEPEKILKEYTIEFRIANPLVEPGTISNSIRRVDPSHEEQIYCKATLLDSLSTEADMRYQALKDSLDQKSYAEFRKKYLDEQVNKGQFRIRIGMESGFSQMSLDPKYWAIYIIDSKGVMIEPVQITASPVVSEQDSIFINSRGYKFPRNRIYRELTLFFNRTTFFKEDLFGPQNKTIALEITREKKTLARVAWKVKN
jgi:hypothetical protein